MKIECQPHVFAKCLTLLLASSSKMNGAADGNNSSNASPLSANVLSGVSAHKRSASSLIVIGAADPASSRVGRQLRRGMSSLPGGLTRRRLRSGGEDAHTSLEPRAAAIVLRPIEALLLECLDILAAREDAISVLLVFSPSFDSNLPSLAQASTERPVIAST